MSFNLATILHESAAAHPNHSALWFGDTAITYQQLEEAAARAAGWFISQDLPHGSRVAMQLPNSPELITLYFGALRAGLVTVPLNPMLRPGEVAHQLADCRASLLVTAVDRAGEADLAKAAAHLPDLPLILVGDPKESRVPEGRGQVTHLADLLAHTPATTTRPTDPMDTAVIIYTSGTTGRPKGAELTHFQLYMNCTVSGERVSMGTDDVVLATLPMFHVFGLSSVLNSAIRFAASVVVLPAFDPHAALTAASERQVSLFFGVPTMFIALREAASTSGLRWPTLRFGISGGAAMPEEALRAFEEQFPNAVVLEGYGATESASAVTASGPQSRRSGSIGRPIWGVEVRIVDDKGTVLPPGAEQVGELQFRGHNVMKGYFGSPEVTAAVIRDGWFATGDLGYQDEDGYFFIVDRKKDLVVRGGYNVYPREIEEVLYRHPAVREAAVIGEPDARLGEEVVAVVTLVPGTVSDPEEIRAFVKGLVAPYKYPRRVRVITEFPKSPSGKILKRELRLGDNDSALTHEGVPHD